MATRWFNNSSKLWVVQFRWDGRRHSRSFKSKEQATGWKELVESDLSNATKLGSTPGVLQESATRVPVNGFPTTTADALEKAYFEWTTPDHATETTKGNAVAWRALRRGVEFRYLHTLTPEMVQAWKKDLSDSVSIATVNFYLRRCRVIFNWAVVRGMIETSPFEGVKKLSEDTLNPKPYLKLNEANHLIGTAGSHSQDIKNFIMLCLYAGLRAGEALNARWEWFKFSKRIEINYDVSAKFWADGLAVDTVDSSCLTVQSGHNFRIKARQARTIPLHAHFAAYLITPRKNAGYLIKPERIDWNGETRWHYRKQFETVAKRAGLTHVDRYGQPQRVTAHILRHTFASMLAQNGFTAFQIMKYCGHSDIRVSESYAHLAPETVKLKW